MSVPLPMLSNPSSCSLVICLSFSQLCRLLQHYGEICEEYRRDAWEINGKHVGDVAQAATDVLEISTKAIETEFTSEVEETLLAIQHTYRDRGSIL